MKKHVISLYSLIVILIIVQIAVFVYFTANILSIQNQLNATNTRFQQQALDTQEQLSQLTSKLISTQESLTQQLSELKASTSADFSGIIEQVVKGVVSIKTDVSQGSGFIITSDGYLITNAHVLSGASLAKALTSNGELKNAELIGYNLELDLALLKIPGSYNKLELADSSSIKVGEKVIAVGNPYGLSFSVTEGIVSALNREDKYIQTDGPLNPGNSGGPLINKYGKVIGVNNFKYTGESLGFALESNLVRGFVNDLSLKNLNQTLLA